MLRGFGRHAQAFQLGQCQGEQLRRRFQAAHRVQHAARAHARSQGQSQPRQAVFCARFYCGGGLALTRNRHRTPARMKVDLPLSASALTALRPAARMIRGCALTVSGRGAGVKLTSVWRPAACGRAGARLDTLESGEFRVRASFAHCRHQLSQSRSTDVGL